MLRISSTLEVSKSVKIVTQLDHKTVNGLREIISSN
jgi:hypothetical protein